MTATGLALANWLADAAVLAVSIRATGATVPWHDLLLVYGSGIAAQNLNITPGGLGVTEGSLSLALVATGLGASRALAAVLLYRLASFWLVALAGWLVVFWLRRPRARCGPAPSRNRAVPGPPAAAWLDAHELVLLHGQPGSPADWQQVAGCCPPSFTPWPLTGRATAPASSRPAGSPRTPAPSSTTWTRAASRARCSWGTPTAAGWRCRRRPGARPGRGGSPARERRPGVRDRLGQAARRTRRRPAVRAGGVAADAMDRPGPAGQDRPAARPPAASGRACQLAGLGPCGPRTPPAWRTFLTEQRALLRELGELEHAIASVRAPVLVLADPKDTVVPFETARRLARALPDARLQLVEGAGHHLPRRAPEAVADAIASFLSAAQIADVPITQPAATWTAYESYPCW